MATDMRTANPPSQRLPPDILFSIFFLCAQEKRPRLCSCLEHGPGENDADYCCCDRERCIHDYDLNNFLNPDPHRPRRRLPRPGECIYTLGWVALGHVCRLWRSVLMDMRVLWANDVCTLNNEAMAEFVHRAQGKPLLLDYDTAVSQHMRRRGSRDARAALLRANAPRAHTIRIWSFEGDLAHLRDGLSLLEVLELSTKKSIVIDAPNLRETVSDGPVTLLAPKLLQASFNRSISVLHAPSVRSLKLTWQPEQCLEIPLLLVALPCLEELAIHLESNGQVLPSLEVDQHYVSYSHVDHDLLELRSRHISLSLPTLARLRITGHGAAHRSICALLDHLTKPRDNNLHRLTVQCSHPKFTKSSLAINAFRASADAMEADSVYLHFRKVEGGVMSSISASRHEHRYDLRRCPWATYTVRLPTDHIKASIDFLLPRLLPLELIAHLHLECLPSPGSTVPALSALGAALSKLTNVHTLWMNDNDRYPRPSEAVDVPYTLVGSPPALSLPSLETLNIVYARGMFRDWWRRLAIALAARRRVGLPLTTLCVVHNWGKNVHRPSGATRTLLETFHEQSVIDLRSPDDFIDKATPDAFLVDGVSLWSKEKVEDTARSLFAQVVSETVKVEEASEIKPVWTPS